MTVHVCNSNNSEPVFLNKNYLYVIWLWLSVLQPIPAARTGSMNFDIHFLLTDADVSTLAIRDVETHVVQRAIPAFPEADLMRGMNANEQFATTGAVSIHLPVD